MKHAHSSATRLALIATIGVLTLGSVAVAQQPAPQLLKACHDAVWEQGEFKDIPNAGISIVSGEVLPNGRTRVHWKVDWDNNHARGTCVAEPNGNIFKFEVHSRQNDYAHGGGADEYYDTHSRRWKTPDGQVCHTCTPENGYPQPITDGNFYYDGVARKWRDSAERGAICHTCTPENGFNTPD